MRAFNGTQSELIEEESRFIVRLTRSRAVVTSVATPLATEIAESG